MKLVFATNNAHKLDEVRKIISNKIEIVSLNDINCTDEIPETNPTLQENALQKAQYIYNKYGFNCFADDTGLEIDALNGEPGVYSARYAGEPQDAQKNRAKVLEKLAFDTNRKAQFRTVISLIIDGEIHYFEGNVKGEITISEKGENGFGYDAIFIPEGHTKTFAELPDMVKNTISHRADAVKKLSQYLNNRQ